MFDISWDDQASETVGQHRERKERDERRSARGSAGSSLRSEDAIDNHEAQISRRPSIFHKVDGQEEASAVKLALSQVKNASLLRTRKKLSGITANTDSDSQGTLVNTSGTRPQSIPNHQIRASVADTMPSSRHSQIFLDPLGRASAAHSSWSSVTDNAGITYEIQSLKEDSFVTRSTEVTTAPQNGAELLTTSISKVNITADPPYLDAYTISTGPDIFQFPKVPRQSSFKISSGRVFPKKDDEQPIVAGLSSPLDIWKPPVEWACPPDIANQPREGIQKPKKYTGRTSNQNSRVISAYDPETTHLQRHIRRMASASPKIILERLREDWTEVTDVAVHKELEFEKQLWMLTALKFLSSSATGDGNAEIPKRLDLLSKPLTGTTKVLSLYENQASASFLATFTKATEVHHLSISPLLPSIIPTIHPITVPNPHHQLPYAPHLFSSITSLTLPSVLQSSSILPLLRECHRVLLPGGTLCLKIIRPAPVPATLGPRLRAWLDKHLLLNLEKQFRCLSPGRLIPAWLQEAGFLCSIDDAAQFTILRFPALERKDDDAGAELTAVVGRMLWKEMWGEYVQGEKWWWEDDGVLRECEKFGTRWECAVVEAVKKG